ncbi:hypothetical protein Zmor_014174 [Zophobas morio]|uniref:Uncharacterized protein n=1 Tax=Zophobas morio TaxID=2755281 RepID=A0AA38MGN8_9CUCU|nr:hypothetical protein Zmor_014174 [Zophobas morio]
MRVKLSHLGPIVQHRCPVVSTHDGTAAAAQEGRRPARHYTETLSEAGSTLPTCHRISTLELYQLGLPLSIFSTVGLSPMSMRNYRYFNYPITHKLTIDG